MAGDELVTSEYARRALEETKHLRAIEDAEREVRDYKRLLGLLIVVPMILVGGIIAEAVLMVGDIRENSIVMTSLGLATSLIGLGYWIWRGAFDERYSPFDELRQHRRAYEDWLTENYY